MSSHSTYNVVEVNTVSDHTGTLGNDHFQVNAISSGAPDAILDGEAGNDILDARNVFSGYSIMFFTDTEVGQQNGFGFGDYVAVNFEEIFGNQSHDNWFLLQRLDHAVTVHGGAGDDWFAATFDHQDTFYGYGGNDEFNLRPFDRGFGGDGDDVFSLSIYSGDLSGSLADGGAGRDTLDLGAGWTVNLTEGFADTPMSGSSDRYSLNSIENVQVSAWRDSLSQVAGSSDDNLLRVTTDTTFNDGSVGVIFEGLSGNDTLLGSRGDDVLDGGAGDDLIAGGNGDDLLLGGTGRDLLLGGTGVDTVSYFGVGAGVSFSLASGGSEGAALNDRYWSFENAVGTSYDDNIEGEGRDNVIDGGAGNDTIWGAGGDDSLLGGAGNDVLEGGAGHDSLQGGDGDDWLSGGDGANTFDGGFGIDTASYATADGRVNLDLRSGGTYGDAANDRFILIENVVASAFNDYVHGDDGSNVIDGGAGLDRLRGGGGDDTLVGGAGGDDLRGGAGIDTASYAEAGGRVNLDLRSGGTYGDAANDSFLSIENVIASDFDDYVYGNSSANRIEGGQGDDRIRAHHGNDTVIGGAGADDLRGGSGADVFVFNLGSEIDTIRDFQDNFDTIEIARTLVGTDGDAMGFASQVGADVHFDFGNGDVLRVDNMTLAGIEDDLVIV
ncbi:Hemolysin-type calcium-binding protein repeat protein (2 copies) [Marinovum algicola DG 898]|nr:Hemolysin-type calcium-binding protein repeat protein (2 copies) [Marinovum algicola DG 898]